MVLTAQSSVLRARQLAGELLTFTNVKIGDGILSAGQTESSMTDLNSTLKTVPISSLERINSDQVQLEFNYSNEGFTSEKYVREYGVFAKIGNEAEVLYAYENTNNKYDTFPAYTTSDTLVRAVLSFILKVAVSGTTQVLINENIVFPTHEEIDTEISALLQANKNLIINGGGQLTWGITANIFNWSKNLEMFPGDGKLKYKGIQIKEIIIAPGTVTLANAWDCAYISIPTSYSDVANKKVTATMTVGQYSAISGTDKFIIAVRDSDSCLQMRDGWLPYGTTVLTGGKRDSYVDKSIFIANNDFVVGTGAGTYAKKTLAETKTILGINGATSGATGVIQLATSAEVTAGTDTAKAVTPATLKVELDKKLDDTQLSTDGTLASNSDSLIPSQKATKNYVDTAVANLINSSPAALNTLDELAAALGDDANFATTMTNTLAGKIDKSSYTASGDILVGTGAGTYAKKTLAEIRDLIIPTGLTCYIHGTTPLAGFIKKNGALLSRTTYANLWAYAQASGNIVDETTWNAGAYGSFSTGDGSTTFRIPDDRGYFDRAWDDGRGVDSGRAIGTSQVDDIKLHNHTATSSTTGAHAHTGTTSSDSHYHGTTLGSASGSVVPRTQAKWGGDDIMGGNATANTDTYTHYHSFTTSTTGDHAHTITVNANGIAENRVKNIAKLAIIKY